MLGLPYGGPQDQVIHVTIVVRSIREVDILGPHRKRTQVVAFGCLHLERAMRWNCRNEIIQSVHGSIAERRSVLRDAVQLRDDYGEGQFSSATVGQVRNTPAKGTTIVQQLLSTSEETTESEERRIFVSTTRTV